MILSVQDWLVFMKNLGAFAGSQYYVLFFSFIFVGHIELGPMKCKKYEYA